MFQRVDLSFIPYLEVYVKIFVIESPKSQNNIVISTLAQFNQWSNTFRDMYNKKSEKFTIYTKEYDDNTIT